MRKCPVCPFSEIDDEADRCPSCGTDLSPLNRVARLPSVFLHRAQTHLSKGQREDARVNAAAAVALNPQSSEARKLYGKVLWNAGHFRPALAQFVAALECSPDDEDATGLFATARTWFVRHRCQQVAVTSVSLALLVAMSVVGTMFLTRGPGESRLQHTSEMATGPVAPALHEKERELEIGSRSLADLEERLGRQVVSQERLQTTLAEMERERKGLVEDFASYRKEHSHLNTKYDQTAAALAGYAAFATGLVESVRQLRPYDADELAQQIAGIRAEITECEEKTANYRTRTDLVGWLRLRGWRKRQKQLESQLAVCEQQRELRIEPWAQALETAEREVASLQGKKNPPLEDSRDAD